MESFRRFPFKQVALTQNVWTKLLEQNPHRRILDVYNENASSSFRLVHKGEPKPNPNCIVFAAGDHLEIDGLVGDTSFMADTTGEISAQINLTNSTAVKTIFSLGDTNADTYLSLYCDADEKLGATLVLAGTVQWVVLCSTALTCGEWHNVKIKHNGTKAVLYVDDQFVPQTLTATTDATVWLYGTTGLDNARIGALNKNSGGNTVTFVGNIDWVEVKRHLGHNESGKVLVARWMMDEGTGTTTYDATDNSYDATFGAAGAAPAWTYNDYGKLFTASGGTMPGFFWDQIAPIESVWALTSGSGVTVQIGEGY